MIVAIVQARMGSSRLPGKVLQDICGQTMVERVLRAASSSAVDRVVAAIPDTLDDDPLFEHVRSLNFSTYRGSPDDVLNRFYETAVFAGLKDSDLIVRLTADCPLMMSSVVSQVVRAHAENSTSYTSNVRPPTFPDGLDVEVFSFESLRIANDLATRKFEREHVTPFIYQTAGTSVNVRNSEDLSEFRLTVDHQDDLDFVREFVERFEVVNLASLRDNISQIRDSRTHERNEGLTKSIKEEESHVSK